MHIDVIEGRDAASARGHAVIIDVLRAFTTAAYALGGGAREIWLCATADEAFALRRREPGALLVGEDGGRKIAGFDLGNSPAAMARTDVRDRVIILRSSNGTQGVVQARGADAILLGSLVVARATADFLRREAPATLSLVVMGWLGDQPVGDGEGQGGEGREGRRDDGAAGEDGAEDRACARYIAALLAGDRSVPARGGEHRQIIEAVRQSPAGRRALDPAFPWISAEDLACATEIDRFDFAMPVQERDGVLVARAT